MWVYFETLPPNDEPFDIVRVGSSSPYQSIVHLVVTASGSLEFETSNTQEPIATAHNTVRIGRWTQLAVVHTPQKAPSINTRQLIVVRTLCDNVSDQLIQEYTSMVGKWQMARLRILGQQRRLLSITWDPSRLLIWKNTVLKGRRT